MTYDYVLKGLRIEGFKSFRDPVDIEFPAKGGLRFLTGRNEAEPRLGANGAGKTSIWDALTWCLYGTSVLGDKASDLTNWAVKRPFVQARFNDWKVERQGSPERIHLDGAPVTQDELSSVLGLSRARFLQSVIFGQRAAMFLDLSIPARGALLDETLDLGIWARASDAATERARAIEGEITRLDRSIAHAQGQLAGLPNLDELKIKSEEWKNTRARMIETAIDEIEAAESRIAAIQLELDALGRAGKAPDQTQVEKLRKRMDAIRSERDLLQGGRSVHTTQERLFRSKPSACPTCLQPISAKFAADKLHEYECAAVATEIEIEAANKKFIKARDEFLTAQTRAAREETAYRALSNKIDGKMGEIVGERRYIDLATAKVNQLIDHDDNPYPAQIAAHARKTAEIEALIESTLSVIDSAKGTQKAIEYWAQGFKKVRLFIVKRILLQLEIETANAASLLGIGDWNIGFATEVENKSGGFKQGVQIRVISPDAPGHVALPSGGEGQRLRIAVEMGLASLIQRRSGVLYNFEVWDEPSAFLSDEGLEDLLNALRYRTQTTKKSIWLTDHRTYSYNFDDVWTVVKTADGSTIERT